MLRVSTLAAFAVLAACSSRPEQLEFSGPTMGTQYSVKIVAAPDSVTRDHIQREIDTLLDRIDSEFSTYRADSAISKFNSNVSTDWLDVPASLAQVVTLARDVSERSGGAFDITAAPLIDAWGFGAEGEPVHVPTVTQIDAMRAYVGHSLLDVRQDPPALRKRDARLRLDVNGIAPGYAVDLLARRFHDLGLENFMIDIGGEVLARGRNADGVVWRIAVERPIDAEPTPFAIVELGDRSITTSGEYRHYYVRDGKRYSHTIDPRTAQPIERHGSVAVVGERSADIDAWATTLNVLGPDRGLELAERERLAVMYIVEEGGRLTARKSSRFERDVRMSLREE